MCPSSRSRAATAYVRARLFSTRVCVPADALTASLVHVRAPLPTQVTCPTCKIHVCYICRLTLATSGYDHFCQHPHSGQPGAGCPSKCGKCLLHTNTQQDDARDVEEERRRAESTT